jgi:ADP-ribose pyrophosphatase YjhB (NUDIX family)
MEEAIRCGGIVIIKDDEVLLVKSGQKSEHLNDTFGIPSGRANKDESDIDCAIREFKEETGLDTTAQNLKPLPGLYVAKIERKREEIRTFSLKVFKCSKFSGRIRGNEETTPIWVKLSELSKLNLLPNIKRIVDDSLKH